MAEGDRSTPPRVGALLVAIQRTGSLRGAARLLGMAPGNAHRALRREERRLGVRLVEGSRGGRGGGGSRLTAAGRKRARDRLGLVAGAVTWWPCRLVDRPEGDAPLRVEVPGAGVTAFVAPTPAGRERRAIGPDADLELGIAPEAVTIRPRGSEAEGSARNRWVARVARVRPPDPFGVQYVQLEVGARTLTVSVTPSAVAQLGLRSGLEVTVELKATALRLRERGG